MISIIGNKKLIGKLPIALFCSVKCPGSLILKTHDLIKKLRFDSKPIISGFHAPIEKECLRLLLNGKAPIIVCPARNVRNIRIPKEWIKPLKEQRMLVVSKFSVKINRPTIDTCIKRNQFVASLAKKIFIPYAAPGSKTEILCKEWLKKGKKVITFNTEYNKNLLKLGAENIDKL